MTVNSAYGYRLLGNHPQVSVNQWEYVKQELVRDPSSRRAVMLILAPFDLRVTKDLPCTAYLQFFIRNDRLYLAVNMRSNDLVLGFANDVFAFTLFQEQMRLELQATYPVLQMGEYYHFAGSMHIYERNFPMIESVLHEPKLSNDLTLPHMADLSQIDNLQEIEALLRRGEPTDAVHLSDPFSLACAAALHD
jgi:thymidylate synthase